MNNRGYAEKKIKDENLRNQWNDSKRSHIYAIGLPEEEEKDISTEKAFQEIVAEYFPNLAKVINLSDKKKSWDNSQDTSK